MDIDREAEGLLGRHGRVFVNPPRAVAIEEAIAHREALVSASGALATWTPPESTGRRSQDTYIVDRPQIHDEVDWSSPYCHPVPPETFEMILADGWAALGAKPRLFLVERALGADPACSLMVRLITDHALTALFADNMLRPIPPGAAGSAFAGRPFTLLVLPYDKLDPRKYEGRLRTDPATGRTSDLAVVMDFALRAGIVYGSAYLGSVKKLPMGVRSLLSRPPWGSGLYF